MQRRRFLGGALIGTPALLAARTAANGAPVLVGEARERIERAKGAALAFERRDWEQGVLAHALYEAGDLQAVVQMTVGAVVQKAPDGRLAVVLDGGPTDPAMGGEAYAQAARLTGDAELQAGVDGLLDWILKRAPRASDGTLYHVFKEPEVWSDGFHGAPPFLAAMGHYDEALRQIEGFRKRLWDPQHHLLWHIWNDGKQQYTRHKFWGVGNGWAAAGLARVIRSLPAERQADRERLAKLLRELIDGCLAYQRGDGLFHDILDDPSTFVETNLAQMLAYAIYTSVGGGWLPADYIPRAERLRAAARAKLDQWGFVRGVCGAPNFDHAGIATEGQAFCILMEAAGEKYAHRASAQAR
jgi:rhamnogalacturonyl hydrolase YesR